MEQIVRFSPKSAGGGGTVASCPFPVGFGGFFQTDPNSIYSGTAWEQKKDVFILAAGTAYPAGSTGGETEHVLTVDEMPAHNHSYEQYLVANDGGYGSWVYDNQFDIAVRRSVGSTQSVGTDPAGKTSGSVCHEANLMDKMSVVGGSQPHNNMPPYFAMPFWIRTA